MTSKVLETLLAPHLDAENKTFFGMSSILQRNLDIKNTTGNKKVQNFLNEPVFQMSNLGKKYRTINYLETTGLINDSRDEKGIGWRKLGLSEFIYISILLELRKFGMKIDQIKHFKELYEKYSAHIIFSVLSGNEITMIFKHDGFCALLDPIFLSMYLDEDNYLKEIIPNRDSGEIQLKLSHFIDKALELLDKPLPYITKQSESKMRDLKKYEKRILEIAIDLKPGKEKLTVRQTKSGDVILDIKEELPIDDETTQRLNSLVDEDFYSLKTVVRDGKVVNLEKTRTEKISEI